MPRPSESRQDDLRDFVTRRIVHYWILNLIDRQLETFSDPTGPTAKPDFRTAEVRGPTDLVPLIVDGNEVGKLKVFDLLP